MSVPLRKNPPRRPRRARHPARRWVRPAVIGGVLLAAAVIAVLGPVHEAVSRVIAAAEPVLRAHPVAGTLLFLFLAALSAVLAFFSSALLVPIALEVWGPFLTGALLWLGWLGGGAVTYSVGRFLGRRAVMRLLSPARVRYYERRLGRSLRFPFVLLLQSALPSEVPGYVLGLLRYPPALYLLALGIAELPYAIGSVTLGKQFLEGRVVPMVVVAVGASALLAWAGTRLHRELEAPNRN